MFVDSPVELQRCPQELQGELVTTLLDVLRRNLAIKVDVLDPLKQRDLVTRTHRGYWTEQFGISTSCVSWYSLTLHIRAPRGQVNHRDSLSPHTAATGGISADLSKSLSFPAKCFGRTEVDAVIQFLFLALKRYGIVEQVRSGDVPGYQINPDALRWVAGNGEERPMDRTRLLDAGEIPPQVNDYFVECYRRFVDLKAVLEAREHTAQVTSDDRREREDRFRTADLPLLFCSPTMELGVILRN